MRLTLWPVSAGPCECLARTGHGGVLNRGGVVVVGDAAQDRLYTDMEAFKSVLELAAIKLR